MMISFQCQVRFHLFTSPPPPNTKFYWSLIPPFCTVFENVTLSVLVIFKPPHNQNKYTLTRKMFRFQIRFWNPTLEFPQQTSLVSLFSENLPIVDSFSNERTLALSDRLWSEAEHVKIKFTCQLSLSWIQGFAIHFPKVVDLWPLRLEECSLWFRFIYSFHVKTCWLPSL